MKIKGRDREVFTTKTPFAIPDDVAREFEAEFTALSGLFVGRTPQFRDIVAEIRQHVENF